MPTSKTTYGDFDLSFRARSAPSKELTERFYSMLKSKGFKDDMKLLLSKHLKVPVTSVYFFGDAGIDSVGID